MLVVISDLHLTDGTTGQSFDPAMIRMLKNRLGDMAYDASWSQGAGGGEKIYEPIKEMDIVLLGDIFDLIRSTAWTDVDQTPYDEKNFSQSGQHSALTFPNFKNPGKIRPWDDQQSDDFITMVDYVTDRVIEINQGVFDVFRKLATGEDGITLPPAKDGKAAEGVSFDMRDAARVPVTVRLHYIVGNHDWFYCVDDHATSDHALGMQAIREKVIGVMGLSNTADPFPHDIWADDSGLQAQAIREVCKAHDLFVRHGDEFDKFNYNAIGRDTSTLGDLFVVELFNLFPRAVETEVQGLPAGVYADLFELGNVPSTLMTLVWVDGVLRNHAVSRAQAKAVKNVWRELTEDILKDPYFSQQNRVQLFLVRSILLMIEHLGFSITSKLILFLLKMMGKGISFKKDAVADAKAHPDFSYFVYGHTHFYEYVPLNIVGRGTEKHEQTYINSGTWHNMHMLTIANPAQEEFVQNNVLTFLAFYKDGERMGKAYEVWHGVMDA